MQLRNLVPAAPSSYRVGCSGCSGVTSQAGEAGLLRVKPAKPARGPEGSPHTTEIQARAPLGGAAVLHGAFRKPNPNERCDRLVHALVRGSNPARNFGRAGLAQPGIPRARAI